MADNLAAKTVTWGLARVEKALAPVLARLNALQAEREALETPEGPRAAAADAAVEWDKAAAARDVAALRAMVRRAFPDLTLAPAVQRGDHSLERFRGWPAPRTGNAWQIIRRRTGA